MSILELKFSNSEICEDIVNIDVNTKNVVYFERWTYLNWNSLTLKYMKILLILLSILIMLSNLKDWHTWIEIL